MHYLDFLSDHPKIFIFGKDIHKTNFGGILFIIYIIVMILISLIYLFGYIANEKYSYEVFTFENKTYDLNEINRMSDDEKFNPFLNISITFKEKDMFAIQHFESYQILEDLPKYNYRERFNNSNFMILYKCGNDSKCASFEKYWESKKGKKIGDINFNYQGYKIDHYNESPVYEDNSGNFSDSIELPLNQILFKRMTYYWEMVKYKDQKSLLDPITKRKTEFIFGKIKDNNKPTNSAIYYYNYTKEIVPRYSDSKKGYYYYLPLFGIYFLENYDNYLLYKRSQITFLDVLAKVGALFSTIKFFFAIALSFYSKNFNNYMVVEKLINPPKEKIKSIELHYQNIGKITSINDIDNNSPLIEEQKNEKSKKDGNINNNNIDDEKENNENELTSFGLKKICFFHFFFNNVYFIYSKCCNRIRNQELINITNDIMHKYLSIDYLLSNMISLESLFKDYKWNNPSLNKIENNNLVVKLKNT